MTHLNQVITTVHDSEAPDSESAVIDTWGANVDRNGA